jgi:hypothetical protein
VKIEEKAKKNGIECDFFLLIMRRKGKKVKKNGKREKGKEKSCIFAASQMMRIWNTGRQRLGDGLLKIKINR